MTEKDDTFLMQLTDGLRALLSRAQLLVGCCMERVIPAGSMLRATGSPPAGWSSE
jgi:hypothetical protein